MSFNEELKSAMIALSLVSDMPLPQRLLNIKSMINNKKWEDQDFCDEVERLKNEITSGNKNVLLKKVETFKSLNDDGKAVETRGYHAFDNINEQLAIATFIHNEQTQQAIYNFYKTETDNLRNLLKLSEKSKNYGNISFYEKDDSRKKCSQNEFRPFYFSWQKKWQNFTHEVARMTETKNEKENLFILKIDFIKAYDHLEHKVFYEIVKKHFKDKKDINSEKIFFEIGNVLKSYEYKDGSKIKGIPYGGIVESHIFANILLLNKIQKIIQVINETLKAVGDTNSRVLDFVTYADDSIILFRNSSKNNDKVISNLKKLVDEIKMHDFGDGSKTRILELNSAREKLRNEYLTPSSINAMFEVVKRSENRLIFDHEQTDTLKENIFLKNHINCFWSNLTSEFICHQTMF